MINLRCIHCGEFAFIVWGCSNCGYRLPWIDGHPTPYQVKKGGKHGYMYASGGSSIEVVHFTPVLSGNVSFYAPTASPNTLIDRAWEEGMLVWNIERGGRLNIVFDYGSPTGIAPVDGVLQPVTGLRIVLPQYDDTHHWPDLVLRPTDIVIKNPKTFRPP